MNTWNINLANPLLFIFLLILSLASTKTSGPSGFAGNLTAIIFFIVLLLFLFIHTKNDLVASDRITLVLITILSVSYLFTGIFSVFIINTNSPIDLLETSVIVSFSLISIYIIPQKVNLNQFASVLSKFSAITVVVGLPALFIGPFEILTLDFNPYGDIWILSDYTRIYGLDSYFWRRNVLGRLCLLGILYGIIDIYYNSSKFSKYVLLVNIVGIYLTSLRGILLSIVLILGYLLINNLNNNLLERLYLFIGTIFGLIIYLMFATDNLPNSYLLDINFKGRYELWRASVELIQDRPIFGMGPRGIADKLSNYSSIYGSTSGYYRTGVAAGLIGLTSQILLLIYLTYLCSFNSNSVRDRVLSSILLFYIVTLLFETFSIMGFNIDSVLMAISIGYIIKYRS